MSEEKEQRTPKGTRIPIPEHSDFLGNLKRAAAPDSTEEKSERRGPKK
jgi:hypothetical protein